MEPMMTLSLEVLDEVRVDLENRQGHDMERFSTRYSGLTDRHLMALGILRRVDDGRVDSAAIVHAVTPRPEHAPMTEAEFRRQIVELFDLGILEESQGKYIFSGDQFDEVYLRYLGASRSLRMSAWPAPPTSILATDLAAAVNPISHLTPYLWSHDPADWLRADLEAQLFREGQDENRDLPVSEWSNLVIPLRRAQAAGNSRVRWASFVINVKAIHFTSHFYINEDTSVASFEALRSFASFRERVEAEGGSVTVETHELSIEDVAPFDELINDDPEARETIAGIYSDHGYDLFLDGDYRHSFEAFCQSYEFTRSCVVAVSAAFQALHLEDWEKAIEWADKADAANEEELDAEQTCLAAYDRAIAHFMSHDVANCLADLDRVKRYWHDDLAERNSYLLGPMPNEEGQLELRRIADPLIDVVEMIAEAIKDVSPPVDAAEVHALEP
jgi:hypothetical protein